MHCILNYPTPNENAHLGMIKDLIRKFPDHVPGYSDHTLPGDMDVLQTATLLGATVLEKHFTHDKSLPGNDHYHAMDKEDLKRFWSKWEQTKEILGGFEKTALESEMTSRENARRSLVIASPVKSGEEIQRKHLTWKRPASGISPKYIDGVIGRAAVRDLEEDEVLQWQSLRG